MAKQKIIQQPPPKPFDPQTVVSMLVDVAFEMIIKEVEGNNDKKLKP